MCNFFAVFAHPCAIYPPPRWCAASNHVLENAELEQDVTFEQFVCGMPLCEWLSQRLRVEAYTRSVLMADDTPPADVFGDWEWKDSLVARCAFVETD